MISRRSGILGVIVLVVMMLELFSATGFFGLASYQSPAIAAVQPDVSNLLNVGVTLNGGGATFPQPLIANWTVMYHNTHPNVTITYQSVGSGKGQAFLLNKTVDFGASDAPLSTRQRNLYPNVLHIPETIGSVTASYNIPAGGGGVIPRGVLKLNGTVLANIYLKNVTMWNDAQIQGLNPGLTLPAHAIQTVQRKDSSGTSFVFSSFLSLDNSVFKSTVGASTLPSWPPGGIASSGNLGVANTVNSTAYSIGYVELQYAEHGNLTYATMQNPAGNFILPTLPSTAFAVSNSTATLPSTAGDWSGVSMLNANGAATYPIASFTYLLVYREMNVVPSMDINGRAQFIAMKNFLKWAITTGQNFAPALSYVPLPAAVVALDQAGINTLLTYTEVSTPVSRTLSLHIGGAGWNDSAVGPLITLVTGDHATINFASTDSNPHRWYIDFNNDNIQDLNETNISFLFNTPGPNPYSFIPIIRNASSIPVAGTFTYRDNNTGATGPITILPSQVAAVFTSPATDVNKRTPELLPTIDSSRVATIGSLVVDMRTRRATGNITVVDADLASSTVVVSKTYSFAAPGLQLGSIPGQPGVQLRFLLNIALSAPQFSLSSNVLVQLSGATATVSTSLTRELDLVGRGVVDAVDVSAVASAYGTSTGQPGFNPAADFSAHGVIDIRDLGPFFAALNQNVYR